MEFNLNNNEFRLYFDELLNKFIQIYSISSLEFNKLFKQMPVELHKFMLQLYRDQPYSKTQFEDIQDKSIEIFHYFYPSRLHNSQSLKYEDFTLRNTEHLKEFENFLDKMLILLSLSEEKFTEIFPLCPVVYWDKIDDLRETSHKGYRDSKEYTRCLEKSKKLSFEFEKLTGFNTENDEFC